jgi:serine/threonine protein kinase
VQVGDVLDQRFVVEEAVEKGGLGVVFRGWDLDAEAAVAIKVLARDLTPTDVQRFHRESALLAELRLPGIVRHVASGTSPDGEPFLVMAWLDGETVARRLEHDGFDLGEAIALITALCAPLDAIHARGLVHRDIKPENVFLGDTVADVTLIDLGLARAEDPPVRLTATGVVLGTPGYMAPEQIRGDRQIDARADVFALGCVLYECLTGYAAFSGENFLAVRTKILLASPPPLASLCPEAPPALVDLVGAMLAKSPADRPPSAYAIATALGDLGALPSGPRRSWNTARLTPTVARDATGGIIMMRGVSLDEVTAIVASFGGSIETMDDGATVITIRNAPTATLVRCAHAIRDLRVLDTQIVVTSGTIDDAATLFEHGHRRARLVGAHGFLIEDVK